MKRLFKIPAFILSLFCISCIPSTQQEKKTEIPVIEDSTGFVLPETMTIKLKGMIGDAMVLMTLAKDGENLDGSYLNTSNDTTFSISGSVDEAGNFSLLESDANRTETGSLEGRFINDRLLEGMRKKANSDNVLSFRLAVTEEKPLDTTLIEKNLKACEHARQMKKRASEPSHETDTMCATLKISLMEVETPSKAMQDKINNRIEAEFCRLAAIDSASTTLEMLIEKFKEREAEGESGGNSTSVTCKVITNQHDIFSLSINVLYDNYGAAHPTNTSVVLNFDALTGNVITLKDLMFVGFENKLNSIAEKIFVEENGEEGWDFKPGKFRLCNDFAITAEGLHFYFDNYEIGPYVMGAPEVLLPYDKISDLIRPYGPLDPWLKR